MMDIQTGLVCIGLVILSGAVLLLISMFGMQEKTYEEAIAEQRNMPEDALLLVRPSKDKAKEKKQKRQAKKVKEKVTKSKDVVKSQSSTETDNESSQKETEQPHVNFVSPVAEVLPSTQPQQEDKKKKKKEKVKPILVKKEETVIVDNGNMSDPSAAGNHFEEILPKDDLELRQAQTKSDLNLVNSETENNQDFIDKEKTFGKMKREQVASKQENQRNEMKTNAKQGKIDKLKNIEQALMKGEQADSNSTSSTSLDQSPVMHPKGAAQREQKAKKNKRAEMSLQQMTERDGVNIHILIPLIRKAELTRNDVQVLTDLLLNKHLETEPSDHSEWIEGRQDPVVKLKKQLAEKEKALAEEQETSQAVQSKLKELRQEYNSERSRLRQTCGQYEETIIAKQTEVQGLHARLQHVVDSHVAEKQALTQKLQQLQAQVTDENMMIRKLQEDHGQTHNALQQEMVNQRQQMEMHMARLNEQHQETENGLKGQIHGQLQELEQLNTSYKAELQARRRYEEELKQLTEQHLQSQTMVKSLKETSNHSQDLARQMEDLQRSNKDLEKRLKATLQAEDELKFEKTRLQGEVHTFTNRVSELQAECDKLKKDKADKVSAQAAHKSEQDKEAQRIKEENQWLQSQVAALGKVEREAQQLREENENLAAQVTAFTERPAAEGRESRENGDAPYSEVKSNVNVDFINYETETKKKDVLIDSLQSDLKQKELLIEQISSDVSGLKSELSKLTQYKTDVERMQQELDAQRNKNNDLRQKNWKAMEALNTTEKSLETIQKETERVANDRVLKVRAEEQQGVKSLLERLFPDIRVEDKAHDAWAAKFEESARAFLREVSSTNQQPSSPARSDSSSELEKQNSQLQALVTHYKTIIDDTEGMLNKLQSHIEQEEIRWSQQLQQKQLEIESLRCEEKLNATGADASLDGVEFAFNCIEKTLPAVINQLQSTLKEMEEKLATTETEREESAASLATVVKENEALKKAVDSGSKAVETLTEEKSALSSKLTEESEKIKELNKEIVKLRSTVKIGQDSFTDEHKRRLAVEEELASLTSKTNHKDVPVDPGSPAIESCSSSPQLRYEPLVAESSKRAKNKKRKSPKPKNRLTGWFRKIRSPSKTRKKRRNRSE